MTEFVKLFQENIISVFKKLNEIIKCYTNSSSSEVVTSIPNELKSTLGLRIMSIKGGKDNICIISYNIINSKLSCWGDSTTGINQIPDEVKVLDNQYFLLDNYWDIGYNSICLFFNSRDRQLSKSWGAFMGGICYYPDYHVNHSLKTVKLGYDHACTLNYVGTSSIKCNCWGDDSYGQATVAAKYEYSIMHLELGRHITCIVAMNWHAECWGIRQESFPEINQTLLSIVTGGRHSCGVRHGYYQCYGNNEFGQLDLDGGLNQFELKYKISAGWDYTCFLGAQSGVNCVGFNFRGQIDVPDILGNGQIREIYDLKSGINHSCAVFKNEIGMYGYSDFGAIECWGGTDEYGQISLPQTGMYLDLLFGGWKVAVGHDFTCINGKVRSDDDPSHLETQLIRGSRTCSSKTIIKCIGNNDQGQAVELDVRQKMITDFAAGGAHGCAITGLVSEQSVECWGSDLYGQASPNPVVQILKQVEAGDSNTCVLQFELMKVDCWGAFYYELDQGIHFNTFKIAYENICGLDDEYNGHCYGNDEWGQCQIGMDEILMNYRIL